MFPNRYFPPFFFPWRYFPRGIEVTATGEFGGIVIIAAAFVGTAQTRAALPAEVQS
jgi:hypothetical protein